MSAVLKRVVIPAAAGATTVLRTRAPAVLSSLSVRNYSEGATARDPGWSKKQKAVEDQYAHNRELESIQKMKKQLDEQKKELEERERKLKEEKKA